MLVGSKEAEVETQIELRFHFASRTDSHSDETSEIARASSSRPFGDVRWDGYGGSPELPGQAESFVHREGTCGLVDLQHQASASLPHIQSAVVVHSF